jgi:hypothetical protein
MPLARYKKETLPAESEGAISRNLDALAALSESLDALKFLDGELLADVAYAGAPVTVLHGLRRKFAGYMVLKRSATETVAAPAANNAEADKSSQITLTASGNVTFDLWVF